MHKAWKNEAMIGCESTGHYWYTFYQFVKDHGMKPLLHQEISSVI